MYQAVLTNVQTWASLWWSDLGSQLCLFWKYTNVPMLIIICTNMPWAGVWCSELGSDALHWDLMHWAGIWCTALGSDAPSWDLMHWAGIWYTELGSDALSLVNASATYSCMVVAVPVYMSSLPLSLCAMCVCMFYCSFRALLICVWAHVCMHAHACVHMAYVCMIEQC